MTYQLSDSDKEEANQLRRIANGEIDQEEAEAILIKLFPLRSIMYTQVDAEYVLAMVYNLTSADIDKVMMAFPPQYCFSDYFQED
jgi:hypothetical protein